MGVGEVRSWVTTMTFGDERNYLHGAGSGAGATADGALLIGVKVLVILQEGGERGGVRGPGWGPGGSGRRSGFGQRHLSPPQGSPERRRRIFKSVMMGPNRGGICYLTRRTGRDTCEKGSLESRGRHSQYDGWSSSPAFPHRVMTLGA